MYKIVMLNLDASGLAVNNLSPAGTSKKIIKVPHGRNTK